RTRGHATRRGGVARHGFDEVQPGIETVALIAAKEKRAIPSDRAAEGSAELVLPQLRLAEIGDYAAVRVALLVEVVRGIEGVIAEVLDQGAMEGVAARHGDDADLAAGAGAIFGRVVVRFDTELLDVFEARLQLERRVVLAVHVAGRGV